MMGTVSAEPSSSADPYRTLDGTSIDGTLAIDSTTDRVSGLGCPQPEAHDRVDGRYLRRSPDQRERTAGDRQLVTVRRGHLSQLSRSDLM